MINHSQNQIVSVKGQSMSPYLKEGDLLIIRETKLFNFGDLIFFESGDKYYIHRYMDENRFKGDALKRFDQEFGVEINIKGKAIARINGEAIIDLEQNYPVYKRIISFVSLLNHVKYKVFHRVSAYFVHILGQRLRALELRSV